MQNRRLLSLLLILTLSLINYKCNPAAIEATINVIEVGENLYGLIKELSTLSETINTDINQLNATTTQNIQQETDIKDTYKQYEEQWQTIRASYDNLNSDLMQIRDTSARYFQGLWDNNHAMKNQQRKLEDSAKNAMLQAKWNIEFTKAATSLSDASKMIDDGNDVEKQLQNAAGRAEISDFVGSLKSISNDAKELSIRIENFKVNADRLLNMEDVSSNNSLVPPVHTELTLPKTESTSPTITDNDTNHTNNNVDNSNTNSDSETECHINNLRVDHGRKGNESGIGIHFDMNITNMLNKTGECRAIILYNNGEAVKSNNNDYRSSDGDLLATVPFTPNYQNTTFNDFTIFIPDTAFDLPKGSFDLQVFVIIGIPEDSHLFTLGQARLSFKYNSIMDQQQ